MIFKRLIDYIDVESTLHQNRDKVGNKGKTPTLRLWELTKPKITIFFNISATYLPHISVQKQSQLRSTDIH